MTNEKLNTVIKVLIALLVIVLSMAVIVNFEIIISKSNNIYNTRTSFPPEADQSRTETKNEMSGGKQNSFLPETENKTPADIKLLFFGDMMLDRHVGEKIEQYGLEYLFAGLASTSDGSFFSGYDIVGANLEGAVTDEGVHYAPVQAYDFAFAANLINELKNYGFNFFTIANNHLADQGERGIIETRKNLDELGYFFVGCSDRVVEECSTDVIEAGGKKIGMAGFSMVYGTMDEEKMRAEVIKLASSTDFVVVNIHWGVEYEHNFNSKQQDVAHQLINAGADIIIGHHPHVVQGMETYQGKPIFYSLGNFVFDQYFSKETQEGLAVAVTLKNDSIELGLYPLRSRASQVELMGKGESVKFFNDFIGWSKLENSLKEEFKKGKILLSYE